MGVLTESLCFCKGVGRTERMKATIFTTKSQAMARISGAGTGFLIHRNLLLTTHVSLPSVSAAEAAEIQLQNALSANLFPHRFFITSSVLDLTIVGLDSVDGDSNSHNQQPQHIKPCTKPNLDLGSIVYLLGYTDSNELTVGEGKVVIATDNLIKLSTDGIVWAPGSAGFDAQGNLAFMICDPMKLATSPNTKSSSTSSSSTSSTRKDLAMQFGIPIPIICDWLNQHWEGSLDELNKPKLPIIRLMSTGQKTEHSCASFTLRQVFKPQTEEAEDEGTTSNFVTKAREREHPSCSVPAAEGDDSKNNNNNKDRAHQLGIPSPEIYESRKVTSMPVRKKENAPMQLLDINFPPRFTKPSKPKQQLLPGSDENWVSENAPRSPVRLEEEEEEEQGAAKVEEAVVAEVCSSTGSVDGVRSCSSPLEGSEINDGFSSEEETLYSAETAESRNYTSPRQQGKFQFQQVGRSQSCVSYTRWVGPAQQRSASAARRAQLEKQRSFVHGRKVHSQGAASQRSNDYFSPTVSSIMKKKSGAEERQQQQPPPPVRPRQAALHSSPKWVF